MTLRHLLQSKAQVLLLAIPFMLMGCKEQKTGFKIKPRPAVAENNQTQKTTLTTTSIHQSACAQDLCQNIQQPSLETILEKAGNGTAEQNQYYQEHINPLVEKLIAERQKSIQLLLTKWAEIKSTYNTVSWTPEQMRILKVLLLINKSTLIPQENLVAFQKQLGTLTFHSAYSVAAAQGPEAYIRGLSRESDLKSAIEKVLIELENKNKALNALAGTDLFDESPFIQRLRSMMLATAEITAFSAMTLKELSAKSYASELFYYFTAGAGKDLLNQIPLADHAIKAQLTLESAETKLRARLQSLASDSEQCRIVYNQAINLYPTSASLADFKLGAQKVLEEAHRLYPQTKEIQTAILYPPTNLQMSQDFVEEMRFLANHEFQKDELIKDLQPSALSMLAVATALSPSTHSSICKSKVDLDISDVAHQDSRSIALSWYSIRFKNEGLGILAHELGHVFESTLLPAKASFKSCLVEKHGSSANEKQLSEDFADHFTAQIMKSLNKHNAEIKLNNFACAFLQADGMSLTSTEQSTHSSPLFRALHIHQEAFESLPESCKEHIKNDSAKTFIPGLCQ